MEPKGLDIIQSTPPFQLPPLPFDSKELEPHISEKTLSFHHDKHHRKYVTTTNELIKGTQYEKSTLEQIIKGTAGNPDQQKLFNNAAQAWNHWFYWNCLSPKGGGTPKGKMLETLNSSFGNYDNFMKELISTSVAQFGSGYGWVVMDNGKLKIMKTSNADNPIAHNLKPVFGIDVWEHAYYLDYQNRREDHVLAIVNNLANWDFAEYNLQIE